jgi:hypothetical protein
VASRLPTDDDRVEVIRVALSGFAAGRNLDEVANDLAPLHPRYNTFPGEVLLELAADAIEESGATREEPLDTEGIRKRLLPEDQAHTRAQHYKAEFSLMAAAMVRGGVDPALIDNAARWDGDDFWFWALEALVIYIRAASDRSGVPVAELCGRLAARHGLELA